MFKENIFMVMIHNKKKFGNHYSKSHKQVYPDLHIVQCSHLHASQFFVISRLVERIEEVTPFLSISTAPSL